MRKKVLSVVLTAAMVASLAACGDNKEASSSASTVASTSTASSTTSSAAGSTSSTTSSATTAEALPDAFQHITFDKDKAADEGYTAATQVEDKGDNDGATYGIAPVDGYTFQYGKGPVGDAIFLDGKNELNLNLKPTNTDTWTVSFWIDADRLATYGPTLQMGYNIGKAADAGNDVTWANVTQCEWGEDSAKIFPIVWSRNEASDAEDGTDCWPWMYSFDNSIHGKREWAMVTIVCSGEEQTGATGAKTVGAQFYLNGQKMYDSEDNYKNGTYFEYTWDATLAPNIMKPGDATFESYFGVNYWDTMFKGFVDDLYTFDTALTPGQVLSLYQLGDATVTDDASKEGVDTTTGKSDESTASASGSTAAAGSVTPDANAIESVGKTDFTNAWWTDWSSTTQIKDGETKTVKFKNYTDGKNNWDNYVVGFGNTANDAHVDPNSIDGHQEYAAVRADAWGWLSGDGNKNLNDNGCTYTTSWGDDWATWLAAMNGADVTLTITRSGNDLTIHSDIAGSDGNTYTSDCSIPGSASGVDGDVYFFLTNEEGYIDIMSIE
jgi:hypothetical protein